MGRARRIAAIASAIGIVALGGAYTIAMNVEPLQSGGGFLSGAELRAGGPTQYEYRFVENSTVEWGIGVRNVLPVPVTVRGLATSPPIASPVLGTGLYLSPLTASGVTFEPLHAVTLAPGETVQLAIRERFAGCAATREEWSPGTALVRDRLGLDVTVLGLPRTVHVPLTFQIAYDAPDEDDC